MKHSYRSKSTSGVFVCLKNAKECVKNKAHTLLLKAALIAVAGFIVPSSVFALFFAPRVAAQTPNTTLNFQARILLSSGSLVPDGNYHVEFKIYDTEITGGTLVNICTGNCLWREERTTGNLVRVVNGYVSVNLGSVTAFPSTMPWGQELFITMRIGGNGGAAAYDATEMVNPNTTPANKRMKISAVPLAFVANNVKTANRTAAASDTIAIQTGTTTTSGASGAITIATGNAAGASGNISIDAGTSGTTAGTIVLGTTSQTGLTLGRVGAVTALSGDASSTISFTNFGVTAGGAVSGTTATLTAANALTLGTSTSIDGAIVFRQAAAGSFTTTLVAPTGALAASRTLTIPVLTANATLCTDNAVCAGYAPSATNGYIQLAPASAQADTTTNSTIFINKTGASGNLIQLQVGAAQRLTVDFAGNVVAAGTLNTDTVSATAFTFSGANPIISASTANTGLTVQAPGTGTLTLNTVGAGTVNVGTTNTTTVGVGSASSVTTVAGSTINLNSATINRTASGTTTFNLNDAANTTLALTNSGTGVANLTVDGTVTVATAPTVQSFTAAGVVTNNASGVLASTAVLGVSVGGTGAVTFTTNGVLYGNTTGALQVTAASTGANQCLITTGVGTAPVWGSCTAGGGVTTMAVIGASPNANGATIATNTLTLQPANASFGGVVTTSAQTFAGDKTFNGHVVAGDGTTGWAYDLNSTNAGYSAWARATAGVGSFGASVTGDPYWRYLVNADGYTQWGNGTTLDTNLYRSAASTLRTDTALVVGGNLSVNGNSTVGDASTDTATFNATVLAGNTAGATSRTAAAIAQTNVTTVTITVAGYTNGDIIFINNAGQDYYTRITAGGGTTSLTVDPAVSYDASAAIQNYNIQNIGAASTGTSFADSSRFFQGFFLGGVRTGAGSTTLSDQNLTSTQALYLNTGGANTRLYVSSTGNVGIGNTNNTYKLDVSGDINISTGSVFRVNGTAGQTATCSGGQILQNQVTVGGITTGGTCSAAGSGTVTGSGAANKVAYWSSASALTSTANFSFDGTNLGVGTATATGLQVGATVVETAQSVDNVRLGIVAGTPRLILEDSASATQWEIDNNAGTLRLFQPGNVKLSVDSSGNVAIGNAVTAAAKLHVVGAVNTSLTPASWVQNVILDNAATSSQNITEFRVAGTRRGSIRVDVIGNSVVNPQGTGGTYLSWDEGTGGVIFGNGANVAVGSVGSTGNASFNGTGAFGSTLTASAAISGTYGLTPTYAAWNAYGVGSGGSAIYNDNGTYQALMVVGNTSQNGSTRVVKVYDLLNVQGSTLATSVVSSQVGFQSNPGYSFTTGASMWGSTTAAGGQTGAPILRLVSDNGATTAGCRTEIANTGVNGNTHIDTLGYGGGCNNGGSAVYLNWYGGTGGLNVGNGASNYGVARASAFTVSSSRTLKHDITSINYGLNEVLQLQPVNFKYNDDPSNANNIGFISEDTRLLIPEVTVWNPMNSTYGIDYAKFAPVLVKAIQQQQAQIEVLKSGTFAANIHVAGYADITGNLTVHGDTTLTNLTVTGDTQVQKLTVSGKIITAGASVTAVLGTQATGNGATVAVAGNDTAGNISYAAGTQSLPLHPLVYGEQVSVAFSSPYSAAPRIALTAKGAGSAIARYYVETTVAGFTLHFVDQPVSGTTYTFDYIVIQ